jgi:hypothetical protein
MPLVVWLFLHVVILSGAPHLVALPKAPSESKEDGVSSCAGLAAP